jgi:HEAT repeat protein
VRRAAAVARLDPARDARDLATLLVASGDAQPGVRRAAAQALGTWGGTRAVDALAPLLADPDPDVVGAAAQALRGIRPDRNPTDAAAAAEVQQRAIRSLAQGYGRAGPVGRLEIAGALQALGGSLREAVEAEARLLWDRNERVLRSKGAAGRVGAAEELGRSGRAEAVRLLLPLAEPAGGDAALSAAAIRGLGWSGDPGVVPTLEEALSWKSGEVAEAASWALGNVGDPAAAEALAEAGTRGSARTAQAAVAALEGMPPAPGVGVALCEIAMRAGDPTVASRAAAAARQREADCPEKALAQRIGRGGAEAVAALAALGGLRLPADRVRAPAERALGLLQSSGEARVRAAAARALGLAPYPPASPALQRRASALLEKDGAAATKGKEPPGLDAAGRDELAEVVVAIARLDPTASFAPAHRLSTHGDPALRAAAARAMGIARPPDAGARLEALLADADPSVRTAAAEALGRSGAPAVPALSAALRTAAAAREDGEVSALVLALASSGDGSALRPLEALLDGPHAGEAAAAIARIGGPEAGKALLQGLARGRPGGRIELVEGLAVVGPEGAGEAISAELLSDRPELRAAAARGLGRLRFEGAALRLEALRADYFADVRRASIEALARLPSRAQPAKR